MKTKNLKESIDYFIGKLGIRDSVIVKNLYLGKDTPLPAAVIFIKGSVDKDVLDRDILNPLMLHIKEPLYPNPNLLDYLSSTYISMSETVIEYDVEKAILSVKDGQTVLIVSGIDNFLVFDTRGGKQRAIEDPPNESAIRGAREGFVEDIETNISLIRRHIKDNDLVVERLCVGRRSESSVALFYINDITDKDIVNEVRLRVSSIDTDNVAATGILEQMIEKYPYSMFPQAIGSERPDVAVAHLMEGRVVIILDGTPYSLTVPAIFTDFFQTVEDYYQRTIVSSFARLMRYISIFIVISLPAIYLTFIKFNGELVPIRFVIPIIQARQGVSLPPILEILSMELVVELLREGGLRLPTKIAQTLSVVGGFIIGSAALQAKLVSSVTLVIVGVSVIGTFVIPNYEMSLSIRLLRFPMLILTNVLGVLGIAITWYLIILHVYSLESFGVPYLATNKYISYKDILIRAPLWKMNYRPDVVPDNNPVRQTDFRKKSWRK